MKTSTTVTTRGRRTQRVRDALHNSPPGRMLAQLTGRRKRRASGGSLEPLLSGAESSEDTPPPTPHTFEFIGPRQVRKKIF